MTAFNQKQFYNFCSQLKIETKEQGLKKMGTLLGSQTYVMDEITKGLQAGDSVIVAGMLFVKDGAKLKIGKTLSNLDITK